MIRVSNLVKAYGQNIVVSDFDMTVDHGEAVALWGPNGAGKTTVIRCVLGLVSYDGLIEVAGHDARHEGKTVRDRIGYVPQELAFYEDMTVIALLDYSARLRRVGDDRVDEVIETLGLTDHHTKAIGELSGGLKQRLGLATALISEPEILLLDEPTSNLDAEARESVVRLLDDLRHSGTTLLITSHHVEEVGMLVDRVIAMEQGRKVTECAPSDLAERLGINAWLHLVTPESQTDRAAAALVEAGFNARRNSHGILVEVSAQQKGRAVGVLQATGIDIEDLEIWR